MKLHSRIQHALTRLGACLSIIGLIVAAITVLSPQKAAAVPGVLPPPSVLTLTTSSHDAYARYQTITYSAKVQKAGKLTRIVMSLPAGVTATTMRSSSGTVTNHKPGQIIWRPAAPISVVPGTQLGIPVVGLSYAQPGTTNLWLTSSDAAGEVLAYARGNFTITDSIVGTCPQTGNNYIQTENAKPGSPKSEWEIGASKFSAATFAGFANAESYKCGDVAFFKINSQLTKSATAKVYRLGYYGGTGAREIWRTSNTFLTGKQPAPLIRNTTSPAVKNMVDASNWQYNLGIRIDGRFLPGVYLVKFSDLGGREAYVPFTVRDDTGVKHAYLVQQATTTWQAYNTYGGFSFYSPGTNGSSHLNFNRPYADAGGKGAGQYLQLESGLVYWLEKNGYDVAYWTDTDLHTKASQLGARTRNLIIPAHDEYYSYAMRSGLVNGINGAVNLVSLGANQVHRPIIYGTGNRSFEVEGKISGGYAKTTFRSRGPALAEQNILGAQYGCRSYGNLVTNNSWLFNGIPSGTVLEGFANGETDYVNGIDVVDRYRVPVPAGNTILATGTLNFCAIAAEPLRMEIVARTTPAGKRVFGGSTFAYSCFLNNSCYPTWQGRGTTFTVDQADSDTVGRMMRNILSWADTGQVQP